MTGGDGMPDARRTHALIVGVEQYAAGDTWELPGPARDAMRFRAWLRGTGVPDENILLLLAPTGDYDPGVPYTAATHDAVRTALLRELPARDGDLLWVWWGGHGVLDQQDHLRLFCADATTPDKRNLDLESARRTLGGDALPGFHRQLWIVDACQTFEEELGLRRALPTESLPHGARDQLHEQALLLAATRGQRAASDRGRATGLFPATLLELLESGSASPYPAGGPEALFDAVRARFEDLRATGRVTQLPALTLHAPQRLVRPEPPRTPAQALEQLVSVLLSYPLMSDPGERQAVVAELQTRAVERMARHAVPRTDVVAMVRALRRRPADLWLLHDAVTLLDDDPERSAALAEAIHACVGAREPHR
ncbi:caspase family protein [Streptomyces sp. NPDC002004]